MNIVLGVSGSVAAYRAADLARELMRAGATVRALLTEGAERFVSRALFEALTGEPCLVGAFEEPSPGRMAHIDWARQADLILIAPATANTLNKLATGIADDMLTTVVLATTKPVLVAPAMNPEMAANPATTVALDQLRARGFEVVEPVEGDVACGEHGRGKLAAIPVIVAAALEVLAVGSILTGKRVLITSGPTEEPVDAVRYLTNRSSGKMGSAL
ncbi:MAG: bifunctional phosphopantothenoylcysteine decarboxylase/phosphopantothenate--cysteine ligase CoaBC, partial [Armatimonadota bacterium]